tara:strand:- start:362 stop:787 length:426 start_codon:yes stop_codon:yes gene_type:complete
MSNHLYGITSKKLNAVVGGSKHPVHFSTFVASTVYTEDLCANRVVNEPNSELSPWQIEVKKVVQYVGRRKEYFEYLYDTPQYFVEQYGNKTADLDGQLVYRVPAVLVGKKFTGVYDEHDADKLEVVGKLVKSGRSWSVEAV